MRRNGVELIEAAPLAARIRKSRDRSHGRVVVIEEVAVATI
jgi:hypothetical protein